MTEDESRKAFELKASELHLARTDSGRYSSPDTEWAWSVWQTAVAWMQRQQAWRPMDSAPKDGTYIQVAGNNHREIVCWTNRGRWGRTWHDHMSIGFDPVGWLPLPPLPEEKG